MSQKKITRDFINPQGRLIEVTADILLTQFIYVCEADATAGPIQVTLPRADGIGGKEIFVKKIDSGTNAITIVPQVGQTIDGETVQTLSNSGDAIHVVSDNENWEILSLGVGGVVSDIGVQMAYSEELTFVGTQLRDADMRSVAIGESARPGTGQIRSGSVKSIRVRRFSLSAGTNLIQIHKNGTPQGTGLIIPDGGTEAVFTSTEEISFAADDIIEVSLQKAAGAIRVIIEYEYP